MQTFLPYSDFGLSAKSLDYRRLGKQRVEAETICRTILHGSGWQHHPAVKMWTGFESALLDYRDEMIREWICRGYQNAFWVCQKGQGKN